MKSKILQNAIQFHDTEISVKDLASVEKFVNVQH